MTKFLRGDRIWILAEVISDQMDEERVTAFPFLPSGLLDSECTIYADARKARMETPRIEVGMHVNVGLVPYEVMARNGEYFWCRRKTGAMETIHISAITSRRDGPRSTEPVEEPSETPPAGNTTAPGSDKHEWWKDADSYPEGHQMTREEFDQTFPGAHLTTAVTGWLMITPKGYWRLPAGVGTVWTYHDDIPF